MTPTAITRRWAAPAHFPLGPLAVEFYDQGRQCVLIRSFGFTDGTRVLVVPQHTTSDFNSTPRVLWAVFPPWLHPEAGVVHDYLYRNGGTQGWKRGDPGMRRSDADAIHRRILELTGASWVLRAVSYRALRLFGGGAWREVGRRADRTV